MLQCCLLLLAPVFLYAQVIIFSDCNYRGRYEQLGPGNYLNPFQFRLGDNTISSIKISRGFRVELYDNINLIGTPIVLTANYACLNAAINNRISSIRITYSNSNPWEQTNPAGGVSVFTACQFMGANAFLPPGDYARLSGVIGDNAISSFRIPEGMVLELFTEPQFRGNYSGKITSDNSCLPGLWNNRASSARVYYRDNGSWIPPPPPPANPDGLVQLFVGCNFWGRPVTLKEGNFPSIGALLNRQPLGSLQVSPGMTVELYSGLAFSGNLLARYSASQSCLPSEIQFKSQSMRVIPNESGGNWNGKGVALFNDCEFQGRSRVFTAGRYSNITQSFGINPASIRVAPGYTIQLFQQPNFQGISSGKISENTRCLGSAFIGRVRSVIITYDPNGGSGNYEDVVLYSDCYFQGRSMTVRPGYFPTLGSYSGISINPASLRVPQGYEVELFSGDQYKGSRFVINSNNSCLPVAFRNRIRSMTVKYNGYGGGDNGSGWRQEVLLFSSCYFGGNNVSVREGRYRDLRAAGLSNNFGIFSLRVPQGYEVELYPYANFQGARTIIRGDNSCLGTAFRGKVKSFIVRRLQGFQPAGVRAATDSIQQ